MRSPLSRDGGSGAWQLAFKVPSRMAPLQLAFKLGYAGGWGQLVTRQMRSMQTAHSAYFRQLMHSNMAICMLMVGLRTK